MSTVTKDLPKLSISFGLLLRKLILGSRMTPPQDLSTGELELELIALKIGFSRG